MDPTCEAVAEELGAVNDEIEVLSRQVRAAEELMSRALVLFGVTWTVLLVVILALVAK